MKNKKGLLGKIFLFIFLVLFLILGITAYQVYDLLKTIESQQAQIQSDINQLKQGDCSKISSIETRIIILESKATFTCTNPIVSYASAKYSASPYTCQDIPALKNQAEGALESAKDSCDLQTLNNFTEAKIQQYLKDLTSANYKQYANQFEVNISNQSEQEAMQKIKDYLASQVNESA
jgi:hypothetical protein